MVLLHWNYKQVMHVLYVIPVLSHKEIIQIACKPVPETDYVSLHYMLQFCQIRCLNGSSIIIFYHYIYYIFNHLIS